MIDVKHLTKFYGLTRAVDDISFHVPAGQIVGLLGPNGAGKSTTMKMLTCYVPPTRGSASVAGFDVFHQSMEVRGKLGYLPENVPLYPEMQVREYLDFRARLRRLDRATRGRRIGYVLERCWLSAVQRRAIGHLSKGFRQRVGLADALLHDPPVLILDEPTVGLDPTQIIETRRLIKELAGGHTVMLSTHILPEVEAVCDDCIVIAGGRIVARGSPEELRQSRRSQARVLVEVRAPAPDLRETLLAVPGANDVEVLSPPGASPDQPVTVAVQPRDGRDLREAVVAAVVQRGWSLLEVRLERATLEEFFVQVTAQQAAEQATQPARSGVAG